MVVDKMDCNGPYRVTSKIVAEITQEQLDEEGTLRNYRKRERARRREGLVSLLSLIIVILLRVK